MDCSSGVSSNHYLHWAVLVKYDAADTIGEWVIIFFSLVFSFIVTWYIMQYLYEPSIRSDVTIIEQGYKNAGCTLKPDFIPKTAVMWDNGYKQKPFDVAWNEYLNGGTLVLFCP